MATKQDIAEAIEKGMKIIKDLGGDLRRLNPAFKPDSRRLERIKYLSKKYGSRNVKSLRTR